MLVDFALPLVQICVGIFVADRLKNLHKFERCVISFSMSCSASLLMLFALYLVTDHSWFKGVYAAVLSKSIALCLLVALPLLCCASLGLRRSRHDSYLRESSLFLFYFTLLATINHFIYKTSPWHAVLSLDVAIIFAQLIGALLYSYSSVIYVLKFFRLYALLSSWELISSSRKTFDLNVSAMHARVKEKKNRQFIVKRRLLSDELSHALSMENTLSMSQPVLTCKINSLCSTSGLHYLKSLFTTCIKIVTALIALIRNLGIMGEYALSFYGSNSFDVNRDQTSTKVHMLPEMIRFIISYAPIQWRNKFLRILILQSSLSSIQLLHLFNLSYFTINLVSAYYLICDYTIEMQNVLDSYEFRFARGKDRGLLNDHKRNFEEKIYSIKALLILFQTLNLVLVFSQDYNFFKLLVTLHVPLNLPFELIASTFFMISFALTTLILIGL